MDSIDPPWSTTPGCASFKALTGIRTWLLQRVVLHWSFILKRCYWCKECQNHHDPWKNGPGELLYADLIWLSRAIQTLYRFASHASHVSHASHASHEQRSSFSWTFSGSGESKFDGVLFKLSKVSSVNSVHMFFPQLLWVLMSHHVSNSGDSLTGHSEQLARTTLWVGKNFKWCKRKARATGFCLFLLFLDQAITGKKDDFCNVSFPSSQTMLLQVSQHM